MRFFAIHDPSGNISSVVGSPSTGPVMKPVQLSQNELFTEVKLPPQLFDPAKPATYHRLTELAPNYAIQMPISKPPARLVKKDQAGGGKGTLRSLTITPSSVKRPQAPRFDVTLKQPAPAVVHISFVLDPSPGEAPIMFLGSVSMPPGQTAMAWSSPLPAFVLPGTHIVTAMAGPDDTVTAKLTVEA